MFVISLRRSALFWGRCLINMLSINNLTGAWLTFLSVCDSVTRFRVTRSDLSTLHLIQYKRTRERSCQSKTGFIHYYCGGFEPAIGNEDNSSLRLLTIGREYICLFRLILIYFVKARTAIATMGQSSHLSDTENIYTKYQRPN